jgi:hypothetical protein
MLSFLVQTLFALQGTSTTNERIRVGYSCSDYSHFSTTTTHRQFAIFQAQNQQREYALFASPRLKEETMDQHETTTLDWLEERLGFTEEQSLELARRFPTIHTLSIEAQLAPTLDFLQQRIGLNDDQLRKLVLRQLSILNASVRDHLAPNIEWLEKRLHLVDDQGSLQKVVLTITPVYY